MFLLVSFAPSTISLMKFCMCLQTPFLLLTSGLTFQYVFFYSVFTHSWAQFSSLLHNMHSNLNTSIFLNPILPQPQEKAETQNIRNNSYSIIWFTALKKLKTVRYSSLCLPSLYLKGWGRRSAMSLKAAWDIM